jgi:hypothetical protein
VRHTLTDIFRCVEAHSEEEALRLAQESKPEEWETWEDNIQELEVYDVRELTDEETPKMNPTEGLLEP